MCDDQYDMSRKMRELFNKKQEQRAAAKEFWRKQLYNPYSPNKPFDPVIYRYIGLSTYTAQYYRDSAKRKIQYLFFLTPFVVLGYFVNKQRTEREELWRSGSVAYEDRRGKLFY